jgi:hypothetical protein
MNDRENATTLIQRWIDGDITNFEFDDLWPWRSNDKAINEIGLELWRYFTDNKRIVLSLCHLTAEQAEILTRCKLFLESDFAYVHHIFPQRNDLWTRLGRSSYYDTKAVSPETRSYWPFANAEQMGQAASLKIITDQL